jgi:hypothetical protein
MKAIPPSHPAAGLFPSMSDDEYTALRTSIREHGQQEPIVMHEDQILDGRHRYRACIDEGIEPQTTYWLGECGSPTAFVIAKNLHRRHLTSGQKAAIATEALPLFEAEARERQREAAVRGNTNRHQPQAESPVPEIFPEPGEVEPPDSARIEREARTQAAAIAGTNPHYVTDAKRIKDEAPDLFEELRAGEITIPEARREVERREVEAAVAVVEDAIAASDTEGRVAAARLAAAFARTLAHITGTWLPLKPDAVAAVLDDHDWQDVAAIQDQVWRWFAALQAARPRAFSIVRGEE